jgi:hypothetical protein
MKLSRWAVSYESPARDMDPTGPASAIRSRKRRDEDCDPRFEWCARPSGGCRLSRDASMAARVTRWLSGNGAAPERWRPGGRYRPRSRARRPPRTRAWTLRTESSVRLSHRSSEGLHRRSNRARHLFSRWVHSNRRKGGRVFPRPPFHLHYVLFRQSGGDETPGRDR